MKQRGMRVILAAFYTPGIRAIEHLIQAGYRPEQMRLLTHDMDRNQALLAFAAAHGIETKTFSVKSAEAQAWIEEFQPDVIFSLYFRDIIPQRILDIPQLGAVNLHPSLLPKYRGTFSAPWAIINGERYTGFTYHYMVREVDAGNIILQRRVPIKPDDTAYSLYHRLITEGMAAFGEVYRLVVEEGYKGQPQTGEPSYYPRQVPFGGYIDPRWDRNQVERFIRAMYFPPFKGARVKLVGGGEQEVRSLAEYDALCARGLIARCEPTS